MSIKQEVGCIISRYGLYLSHPLLASALPCPIYALPIPKLYDPTAAKAMPIDSLPMQERRIIH